MIDWWYEMFFCIFVKDDVCCDGLILVFFDYILKKIRFRCWFLKKYRDDLNYFLIICVK